MIEETIEMFETVTNSTLFDSIAKAYRKLYLSLIKEGFSKEEAMKICVSKGLDLKMRQE